MRSNFFVLSFGIGAMLLATRHAYGATPQCGPHEDITRWLNSKYGETRQALGLGDGNAAVEIFASADTGTWTITVTKPDGQTCLVATGANYTPTVIKPGEPA